MALTDAAHGTVTTDGTVQTINSAAFTAAGLYILRLNLTNMVNADEIEVIAKVKVLTGGAEAVYHTFRFLHAQGPKVWDTVPLASFFSITFTIKRLAGTDRAYEWCVITL